MKNTEAIIIEVTKTSIEKPASIEMPMVIV